VDHLSATRGSSGVPTNALPRTCFILFLFPDAIVRLYAVLCRPHFYFEDVYDSEYSSVHHAPRSLGSFFFHVSACTCSHSRNEQTRISNPIQRVKHIRLSTAMPPAMNPCADRPDTLDFSGARDQWIRGPVVDSEKKVIEDQRRVARTRDLDNANPRTAARPTVTCCWR
jgi:hypothetical protein